MVKVWICIVFYSSMGGSYGPAVATVDNLARVEDCHRVGKSWKSINTWAGDRVNAFSYRCVEVLKVK